MEIACNLKEPGGSLVIIARHVAETLYELGIRRVYGLPGEDHMALLDAFQGAGLQYCTAFNESSAVIMAATDAQLTGLPGVAVLSLAPGVSNGVNGLLNTFLEEVPLILISGQHPAGQYPFTVRQGFNIEQLVAPMTKWRARVTADMSVPSVLGRAVDEAMSGRPGPVYLEIPDGVATAESTADARATALAVSRLRSRWVESTPTSAVAPAAAVTDLAQRLSQARHPVLVVGGRQRRIRPDTVRAFSTAFRVPVFTSTRQKGVLGARDPFYAGAFLNGRMEKELFDQSDLVVLVEPESFDFYNKPWTFTSDAIALTNDAFAEWMNPLVAQYVADPEAVFSAVLARGGGASEWTVDDVTGYRATLRSKLLPEGATSMSVAHAIDSALSVWPEDGYLVADAGFSKPLIVMLSEPSVPDHFFASNALSTMGYSIPAAVAARRAGASPVLAFLGDGSLLMRATELMVSADDGAPAVFVAIMDRALTQIEVKQERRNLAEVGVELPAISAAKLGEAFGIDGVDVYDTDALAEAVQKGLHGNRPVLIGAYVDPDPSRVLFDLLRG
jgi:acetolactate synthase I/II/III large subunit